MQYIIYHSFCEITNSIFVINKIRIITLQIATMIERGGKKKEI